MGRIEELVGAPQTPKPTRSRDHGGFTVLWTDFKHFTTAHGIPHISHAHGVIKRLIWILISLLFLGLLMFNAYSLGSTYFSYGVTVTQTLDYESSMTFPAVTICNNNPVRKNMLYKNPALNNIVNSMSGSGQSNSGSGSNTQSPASTSPVQTGPTGNSINLSKSGGQVAGVNSAKSTAEEITSGLNTLTSFGRTFENDHASEGSVTEYNGILTSVGELGTTSAINQLDSSSPRGEIFATGRMPPDQQAVQTKAGLSSQSQNQGASPQPSNPPKGPSNNSSGSVTRSTPALQNQIPQNNQTNNRSVGLPGQQPNNQTTQYGPGGPGQQTTPPPDQCDSRSSFGNNGGPPPTQDPYWNSQQPPPPPDQRERSSDFQAKLKVEQELAQMPEEQKKYIGHQVDDLFFSCEYNGYPCYPSTDFTSFYSSLYGNCFTFNSGWNAAKSSSIWSAESSETNETEYSNATSTIQKSLKPGPKYGLSFGFNIEQNEYIGQLTESAGLRVVIHDQDRMPFPEDEAVAVSPGVMTYIGVRVTHLSRMSKPYGNCTDPSISNITRNVYEHLYPVKYSQTACYNTCIQRNTIKSCQCADPQYPCDAAAFGDLSSNYVTDDGSESYIRPCNCAELNDTTCQQNIMSRYQANQLDCDCPLPCTEVRYQSSTTTHLWPSVDYKNTLFDKLAQCDSKISAILNYKCDPDFYSKNLGSVIIYLEDFSYTNIQESAAYDLFHFASDIGGILGLYVGFSLFTIVEFIEFVIDLILMCGYSAHNTYVYRKKNRATWARKSDGAHNIPTSTGVAVPSRKELEVNPWENGIMGDLLAQKVTATELWKMSQRHQSRITPVSN